MAKIPLLIEENRIKIVFSVIGPRIRQPNTVSAIVDTGSTNTFLSEMDTLRLNIPYGEELDVIHGIGGGAIKLFKYRTVKIHLKTSESSIVTIEHPLKLSKFIRSSGEQRAISLGMPSIVGIDFLKENHLSLHIDFHSNEAYLEN